MSKFRHNLVTHDELLKRVQRSLYYYDKSQISVPFSDLIAETFSETHISYSLNRMKYATIGHLQTTPVPLILAMIYMERLKETDPIYMKHITPTELFLVSMMVATKYYSGYDEDEAFPDWAKYGCISRKKLVEMELKFLIAINWHIFVSDKEFFEKLDSVEEVLAKRQGLHRGWFTYMELYKLLPPINMTKSLIQFYVILGLSYAAFIAIIFGSISLVSQIPGSYLNKSAALNGDLTKTTDQSISTVRNTSIQINKTGNVNEYDNNVIIEENDLANPIFVLNEDLKAVAESSASLQVIAPISTNENMTQLNEHRHLADDNETKFHWKQKPVFCIRNENDVDLNFISHKNMFNQINDNIADYSKNQSKYHLFFKLMTKY